MRPNYQSSIVLKFVKLIYQREKNNSYESIYLKDTGNLRYRGSKVIEAKNSGQDRNHFRLFCGLCQESLHIFGAKN